MLRRVAPGLARPTGLAPEGATAQRPAGLTSEALQPRARHNYPQCRSPLQPPLAHFTLLFLLIIIIIIIRSAPDRRLWSEASIISMKRG